MFRSLFRSLVGGWFTHRQVPWHLGVARRDVQRDRVLVVLIPFNRIIHAADRVWIWLRCPDDHRDRCIADLRCENVTLRIELAEARAKLDDRLALASVPAGDVAAMQATPAAQMVAAAR